ncbi:UNVERIFIED_CONTAM: Subtilisin-like protease SBT2.6 [Sesamum radiatum]|uniref:Subtilisin-like protease SBT2.6 n=1 Tax=Sesamum radiatum TaxID=300843 RepID=A0AAW2NQZ8_SESRA
MLLEAGEGFAMISELAWLHPYSRNSCSHEAEEPSLEPFCYKIALMTTSTTIDRAERPLQAQQYSGSETMSLVPATPFDYGSGHVNPRAALDPGLIFDAGYEDYLGFLCTTPGVDAHEIITRTVTNVAEEETYVITARMAPAIAIETNPPAMTLRPGASRKFSVALTVRSVTGTYSFVEVQLRCPLLPPPNNRVSCTASASNGRCCRRLKSPSAMVSLPRRNPSEMIPLSTLLKSGFTPTLKDSNNFLLFLYRKRKFKAIIHIFSQVNSNKINADAQTHTIFAKALLKENRYEEAAEFLKTLVGKSKIFG